MHMSMRRVAVALAIGLTLAGCNAAKSTTPAGLVTPSPVATPTEAPTDTPLATETPLATATPAPTPTPTVSPSEAPIATPTPVAGDPTTCTQWTTYGAEFQKAAATVKFDVYCGVVPSGWHTQSLIWALPKGSIGQLTVTYANKKKTATISVGEGDFCAGDPSCWSSTSDLGAATFGTLSGSLKLVATGQYGVYVNAGAPKAYKITSTGLSQSAFTAIAAAMVKIPKA
jgi:hypothetical protein